MNTAVLQSGFLSSARVRLIRRTEVSECGLACLAMIAGFYGRSIDLATMRRRFTPSLRGAPLSSLIRIADPDRSVAARRQAAAGADLQSGASRHPSLGHEPLCSGRKGLGRQGADPRSCGKKRVASDLGSVRPFYRRRAGAEAQRNLREKERARDATLVAALEPYHRACRRRKALFICILMSGQSKID